MTIENISLFVEIPIAPDTTACLIRPVAGPADRLTLAYVPAAHETGGICPPSSGVYPLFGKASAVSPSPPRKTGRRHSEMLGSTCRAS